MKTENIILVILGLTFLIVFIPLTICELKKYLRNKEEHSIIESCHYISTICGLLWLVWCVIFFLGYMIKIPLPIVGLFLIIFGLSSAIDCYKRLSVDYTYFSFFFFGILCTIIGIILLIVSIISLFN